MKSQYDVERMKFSDLHGSVVLPTYQRKLVWSENQKANFINNISLGYPFGAILLYRYDGEKKLSLIDGLQRFSTLEEYQKDPAKYFTNYGPYVNRVIELIEKGANFTLTDDQRLNIEPQIESALRDFLREDNPTPRCVRDRIKADISIFPAGDAAGDALLDLQDDLGKEASSFLDLDDLTIPCIVFTGSEDQLPDVFANLNQGGTKLSKYQVLAAHWTRHEFVLAKDERKYGDTILDKVVDRYVSLVSNRGFEIEDFDSQEMEESREINLSEYCYALGELIVENVPVFWSNIINSDGDSGEDTFNVVGYLSVAIALNVDVRKINNLASKAYLFMQENFATDLANFIIREYKTINNNFDHWLRVPGTDEKKKYESSAVTDMQILSFFAALWRKHYEFDEESNSIKPIENYRNNGYDITLKNLLPYCVYDTVNRAWKGSGDSRLASYYVPSSEGTLSDYSVPLTREMLEGRMLAWYDDVSKKASLRVEKISKFLLCIYAAPDNTKYKAANYDVEHVVSKQKLKKKAAYTCHSIPGGCLGNIMYLKSKTNRGKGGLNLYAITDAEGVEFDQEYLDMNDYPARIDIDRAEAELDSGAPKDVIVLINSRAKAMIKKIADEIS